MRREKCKSQISRIFKMILISALSLRITLYTPSPRVSAIASQGYIAANQWYVFASGAFAQFYGLFNSVLVLRKRVCGFWDKVDGRWKVRDGRRASHIGRFISWCGGAGRGAPGRLVWALMGIKKDPPDVSILWILPLIRKFFFPLFKYCQIILCDSFRF